MCGIIGYIGNQQAAPLILEGLGKLEYRGYDSAGLAVLHNGKINCLKRSGRLSELKKAVSPLHKGKSGIGHTRWATHGKPTEQNAHPHLSRDGCFAVVHNGIIENYLEIRQQLESEGFIFLSETDTEVIPHLLQKHYNGDVFKTISLVVSLLRGAFALGIISLHDTQHIYAVRKGAPLVIGLSKECNYIASDMPAILSHTRRFYLLEEGEFAILSKQKVEITDQNKNPIQKDIFEPDWDADSAEKDGFKHYMLKEITEQPCAVQDTLFPCLQGNRVVMSALGMTDHQLKSIRKIFIVACGSAYHAGLVGKSVLETLAHIPVETDIASEFRYRNPLITKDDLLLVLSQSGETSDTLEALRDAKRKGASVLSVVNVKGSSIARESDAVLYTHAGPEIAVATTKAYSAQLQVLFLFALHLAKVRNQISDTEQQHYVKELRLLPDKMQQILKDLSAIETLAKTLKNKRNIFFMGRGLDYAVAVESSLKLKEISYIHSEAYAAGELKHGSIALIEEGIPVVAIATQENLFEKTVSNIREVKSRGAKVIAVVTEGNPKAEKEADAVIFIPETESLFTSALAIIPLQILAYFIADHKGLDVDKPRNLAKSVTVE